MKINIPTRYEISEFLQNIEENIYFDVELCELNQITEWSLDDEGHYAHITGRFFKVCGVSKNQNNLHIVSQPEIGLLCLFRTKFEGQWLYLLQAKAEPGNARSCLWAPTIQATRSNFTRMHNGKIPDYFDVYDEYISKKSDVFCDVLLPEQGNVYWQKYNRNVILNVEYFVPKRGFIWVPETYLGLPTILTDSNSCLKSTLSLLFKERDISTSLRLIGLIDYFVEGKGQISLKQSSNFLLEPNLYFNPEYAFEFVGAKIHISSRENSSWQQPLIKCTGSIDVVALRVKQPDGRLGWILDTNYEVGYAFGYKLGLLSNDWEINISRVLEKFQIKVSVEKQHKLHEEGGRFNAVTTNVKLLEVFGEVENYKRFGSLIYLDDEALMSANQMGLIEMAARSMFFIGNVT
jgi:hypothetical protein